jgi:hypothetical protein
VDGVEVDVAKADVAISAPNQIETDLRNDRLGLIQGILHIAEGEGQNVSLVETCVYMLGEGYLQKEIAVYTGETPHRVSEIVRWVRRLLNGRLKEAWQ